MPSSHLILCHPLLLLPPIPPRIRVFSSESTLRMRWPKYWSFSFSIIPSKEHPGLISFRMDWLDLLAVQGTQESSPTAQFKSINSSVLSFLHIQGLPQKRNSLTTIESKLAVTSGKRKVVIGKTGVGNTEGHTIMYEIHKLQGYKMQHREHSQCLIISINKL